MTMQEFVQTKRGLVLGARPEIFHRLGHIPGAVSLPREDFETVYAKQRTLLEGRREETIVVYCSSASCEDSQMVADALKKLGYAHISVFRGGWDQWTQAGLTRGAQMMEGWLRNRWVQAGLSVLLGGVFLYAGASKMAAPQAFADSIASFRLLPAMFIDALALGLPVFEIVLGLLLVVGWQRRAAALGVLGLTGMFALALISALARGLPVDCGCFGGGAVGKYDAWVSLGRDGLLGMVAAAVYWWGKSGKYSPPAARDPL